jgi:hypothetical protein
MLLPTFSANRHVQGSRSGSSSRGAAKRQIRTWFPHRQPQNVCLAVSVGSADPVFLTVVIHFQVVGYLFEPVAITQHSHVARMVKFEKFYASDIEVSELASVTSTSGRSDHLPLASFFAWETRSIL